MVYERHCCWRIDWAVVVAIKISKHDKVFSQCIRERAGWCCERCGKYYPEGHARMGLHMSHFYGRRKMATRFDPDNGNSFCYGCHSHMGTNRDEYTYFKRKELGDTRFDELTLRGNSTMKRTKSDMDELYAHYKAQLAYMQRLRAEGQTGYLVLTSWD